MEKASLLKEFRFKSWEKALMSASACLFMLSLGIYVSGIPLHQYLFSLDVEGEHRKVGIVSLKQGVLRRQLSGEAEFNLVDLQNPLFDEDTVVTGSDGGATLQLDDESTIELAPNTMIHLKFETELGLGGITRAANVEVITGDVTGQAKKAPLLIRAKGKVTQIAQSTQASVTVPRMEPVRVAAPLEVMPTVVQPVPAASVAAVPAPVPCPTPVIDTSAIASLELTAPRPGMVLKLVKGSKEFKTTTTAEWSVSPAGRKVQVNLFRFKNGLTSSAPAKESIFHEIVEDLEGKGQASVILDTPGAYAWELLDSKGEKVGGAKHTRASFTFESQLDGIDIEKPLVGGQALMSNRIQGKQLKNFDITLRWKPYSGVDSYHIVVKALPTDVKPILERDVSQTQYVFQKDRVYNGRIFYQIFASLKNGFTVRSEPTEFSFKFLAPAPSIPANHLVLSRAKLASEGTGILLTWQKTNFTDFYDLEIAQNPEFTANLQKKKLKDNFFMFNKPPEGRYFWRTRGSSLSSDGKSVLSAPSEAFDFTVTR